MRRSITVCITCYNQERYIRQAIGSVLNQTLLPTEILILDDHSNDESITIIIELSKKFNNTRLFFNNENIGITKCRNILLKEAKEDFITFLDGDDYFMPTKLEEEFSLLLNGNSDFVYSNFNFISENGTIMNSWSDENRMLQKNEFFIKTFSLDFPQKTIFRSELVNTKRWKEVGFFDENLQIWEDFDMRIRLTKELFGIYNPNINHVYRRHISGLSTTKINLYPNSFEYILRKNFPLLTDFHKQDKKKVKLALKTMVSEGYECLAYSFFKDTKLSAHKIILGYIFVLKSLRYNFNLRALMYTQYLLFKNIKRKLF